MLSYKPRRKKEGGGGVGGGNGGGGGGVGYGLLRRLLSTSGSVCG